jgi:hypothetical protein
MQNDHLSDTFVRCINIFNLNKIITSGTDGIVRVSVRAVRLKCAVNYHERAENKMRCSSVVCCSTARDGIVRVGVRAMS